MKLIAPYSFALRGQDAIDMETVRAMGIRTIDVVRAGIKYYLKQCPKVPKETIKKAKDIVK